MSAALTRRQVLHGLCGCGAIALGGCVTSQARRDVTAGHQPQANSLEGGIWKEMEDIEASTRHSPIRIRDARLNDYVQRIACRLAGDLCPDIRVYLVETPYFNASMAPNGMMQIWSGLLLRCQSEAELAAVIGHELGHYIRRHSLQQMENMTNQAAFAAFAAVLIAGAGGGEAARLPYLIAQANISSFSREQEAEADELGLELMTRAGYAPFAAASVWQGLVEELDAGLDEDEREEWREKKAVWTASHPTPDSRIRALAVKARQHLVDGQRYGEADYHMALAVIRDRLMQSELRLHQFDRTLVIVDRMKRVFPNDPDVHYYEAEVYRRRNGPRDESLATNAYGRALGFDPGHARAWRGLGILHRRAGRHGSAADAFRRYLELAPAAEDNLMIRSYLGAQT